MYHIVLIKGVGMKKREREREGNHGLNLFTVLLRKLYGPAEVKYKAGIH